MWVNQEISNRLLYAVINAYLSLLINGRKENRIYIQESREVSAVRTVPVSITSLTSPVSCPTCLFNTCWLSMSLKTLTKSKENSDVNSLFIKSEIKHKYHHAVKMKWLYRPKYLYTEVEVWKKNVKANRNGYLGAEYSVSVNQSGIILGLKDHEQLYEILLFPHKLSVSWMRTM